MSGRRAWFFRIGQFSLINDAVLAGLRAQMPEFDWSVVDVERDVVNRDPILRLRATAEAMARYGTRILASRQPPRDFFPRIPAVLEALRKWVREHADPRESALVFQTQSLFDARHPELPHFVYTDHTYLANLRYPQPKPLLPVPQPWRRMESDLYARADCTFVTSGFAAESLREDYGVPEARCEVVFSGANVSGADGEGTQRKGNVILFVGVDWERKGGPELVAAFRQVRAQIPKAELWIVGCAPDVNDPGVRVLGRIAAAEVEELYRTADIFCLPSRMDPSASVLAEAASYALPVVATPVGGNPERVRDGVTGFLCEPHALSARLLDLLRDPGLRQRFGAAGRQLASERFTWDAVCGRMADRMRKSLAS